MKNLNVLKLFLFLIFLYSFKISNSQNSNSLQNSFFIFPDSMAFSNNIYEIINKYVNIDIGNHKVFYILVIEEKDFTTNIFLYHMENFVELNNMATPISYFFIKNKLIIICKLGHNLYITNKIFNKRLQIEVNKIAGNSGKPNYKSNISWNISIKNNFIKIDSNNTWCPLLMPPTLIPKEKIIPFKK